MKSDSKPTCSSHVFECSNSYYNPATKKWDSGHFTLTKSHIEFVSNSDDDLQFHLCLPLSTITCIEKRHSNLIYPSLVISVAHEKHWFKSFPNRNAAYNLLELFWRGALISTPHINCNPLEVSKTNSPLSKELLENLRESENSLIETANALNHQSEQLYNAEEAVEDLNEDLTRAEKVISSLSLPLTFADFPNSNVDKTNPTHRYKVNFSFSNDENKIDWKKGVLIFSDEIILLNVEENTIMQTTKDELESFQVLSPWEFCIVHTFSVVRQSCYFMCPQLSRLLKDVSSIPHYQEKVVYVNDEFLAYDTASSSSFGSINSPSSSSSTHSNSLQNIEPSHSKTSISSCNNSKQEIRESNKEKSDSNQTEESNCALSEEEIQEINRILENLKTLSTEVRQEQKNQLERINTLVENMENTDMRMKRDQNDVKKI